ncbi:hypothetical protein [Oceaniovalibus sp. ACAM 378]|uniref:hypothetical protein n=1 Tax=Oceaniovalibus sp. ACAM 378 TaxID=2599923 RepID=UPI0011D80FDF|nr:hypothetical protein [Oceaniovalibus sp. ACAM 378]TYB83971.1 hypothetical protein FQ320_23415 [Oceaniovalibus sp. ACAM 378]
MSLTFPRTDILAGLQFKTSTPRIAPLWRQETSRTAGGVTLVKNMGPLLWQASYLTVPMRRDRAGEVEADLLTLENGGQLFEGYDPARPFPASDKTSPLTGITIHSIRTDRLALRITGLPASFVLTKGDWLSINDGTNLHLLRAVETTTAAGTGLSAWFEVRPSIRPAIAVGNPVALRYAPARFMVDPGSVQRSPNSGLHDTISWTATQVIT